MSTYTKSNFRQIATALRLKVGQITKRENQFEAAARWYRLDRRRPTRIAPSKLREKLDRVAKSTRRLLKSLGVDGPDKAAEGPGDREIFKALILVGDAGEDLVIAATRRIGRLEEIVEGVVAVAEFDRRAKTASTQVTNIGKLTVRKGNPGNDAINDWIAAMMGLYQTITGNAPATSVGAPNRSNEGIAAGPFIRFLKAAGKPLGIQFSEDAWRSRVRTILRDAPAKN
jgi:hypothetical protein